VKRNDWFCVVSCEGLEFGAGERAMFAIIVLLFAGAVLALVVGAMALLSENRARQDRNDVRYRFTNRRIR
jgi:hypothetical protein